MNFLRTTLSMLALAVPLFTCSQSFGFTLGISGGLATPTGNFALADYSNVKSGFARPGLNLGVTTIFKVNNNWGLTALAGYTAYGFTGGTQLAEGYKDAFGVDSSSFRLKGTNNTLSLLAGPYYTIGISKLHIDLRLMAGLVRASLAGNEITMEDNADATFLQKQAYASTLGLQGGAALRYNLTRKIDIAAGADYAWSKPSFTIENVNRQNAAGRLLTSYNEPITAVNVTVTLLYKFEL